MCQYMVIESWLNEQADAKQRGVVFSGYMIASYLGLVLGQLILVMHPQLGLELLMLVALCFALCLVPVAMTRRIHPAPLHPAPMEPRFFIKRVPQSLSTVLGAGLIVGSFYGLAPLYAEFGLTPAEPARWCEDFAAQFDALVEARPAVASFTFGILNAAQVERLHSAGCTVIGTATTVAEAVAWADVGADAVVASGMEAGGHRGTFLATGRLQAEGLAPAEKAPAAKGPSQ
eukprot:gene8936-11350_t